MKTHLIIILSFLQIVFSQNTPILENNNPVNSLGFGNNLFNSEKLKIQQGFTVGTSFAVNESQSYGMFTNNFQYNIKSNLNITGGVHFLQKSGNNPYLMPQNNFDILYDLNLKYQPWENTWIQLSVSNLGLNKYRNNYLKP